MARVVVEVDVDDVIDQIDDSDLLKEYKERGLNRKDTPDAKEVVARAIATIKTGRIEDGITMLEREFFPTWKDKDAAERAYRLAMTLKAAA